MMYSQSTSGSTQPGERPATARSGDVPSSRHGNIPSWGTPLKKKKVKIAGLLYSSHISILDISCVNIYYN